MNETVNAEAEEMMRWVMDFASVALKVREAFDGGRGLMLTIEENRTLMKALQLLASGEKK